MAPAWLGLVLQPLPPALGVLTWRLGPGLPMRWLWRVMVSRCRVCRTPSCSNWAMSFRGSQGLWLEGPEGSYGQGRGRSGDGGHQPSRALSIPAVARAPRAAVCRAHRDGPPGEALCDPGPPRHGSPLVSVAPLLGGGVQVEQLGRPGREALLAVVGPPPLRLLQ